ncbi:hypothetical protein M4I32_06865 [Microbacterium sp. LRZ72]|uniref:hypothetical protein n=1 Tax=Microbacterium sp. LRZ72 TaxID=2942481 RepID=UPI00299FFD8A|nr:hypothetical protein [Microbacterium sp. LRZ72]MDX2376518.1 hypothetical protein [Microbacterium sp. LRZ72]
MPKAGDEAGFGWTPEAPAQPTVPGTAAFGGAAHTAPAADDDEVSAEEVTDDRRDEAVEQDRDRAEDASDD